MEFIKRFFDVRKGEWSKVGIMCFYFFCIIAANWMIKAVRSSLVLEEFGAWFFRYLYIFEGIYLILVAYVFSAFSKRVSRKNLFVGVFSFFIAALIAFWFLFRAEIPYMSAVLYMFSSSFGIMMTTQFFILANDIFDTSQGKRLFGIILSAGSVGHMLGGFIVSQAVKLVGTVNLLLLVTGMVVLCMVFVMSSWNSLLVHRREEPDESETRKPERPNEQSSGKMSFLSKNKLFLKSSYLICIALLVVLAKMTSTVVENQFQGIVEIAIIGQDERTAFYGQFYMLLGFVSFFMQFVLTSVVFKYLGVNKTLWVLPIGLALFSITTFFYPVLLLGVFMRLFDGGSNYSIQQASREVLYLPVDRQTRYQMKPYIDMLGFRLARTFGGFFILIFAPLFQIPDYKLSSLVLFLIPIWLFVVHKMGKHYNAALKEKTVSV